MTESDCGVRKSKGTGVYSLKVNELRKKIRELYKKDKQIPPALSKLNRKQLCDVLSKTKSGKSFIDSSKLVQKDKSKNSIKKTKSIMYIKNISNKLIIKRIEQAIEGKSYTSGGLNKPDIENILNEKGIQTKNKSREELQRHLKSLFFKTKPMKFKKSTFVQSKLNFIKPTNTPKENITIATINVNGIRSALKKGLIDFLQNQSPTIVCFQETKVDEFEDKLPSRIKTLYSIYSHRYWNSSDQKGLHGVSTWSKIKPDKIQDTFKGRGQTLFFKHFILLQTYVPNSDAKNGDQIRKKWNENINKHINKLKLKNTPVIWTGDLNVSYLPTDSNYKSIAGTKQYEKQHIIDTINNGFVDVYKHFNLNTSVIKQRVIEKAYTLIIRNFKNKILKMRLDYFLVEKELLKHIENIYVDQTTTFSDHFPLIMKTNLSTI